uniref:Tetraspanin n=1 Tax=Glossina brevipalpis TaxID=37001 RepID=A0A1A9WI16_9MUSC
MCYAVFMFILLILQSVALVLLWTNKEEISRAMGKVIESAWETESRQAGVFEAIQKSLKCCGVNGVIDYTGIVTLPPPSCCHNDSCVSLNFYGGCRQKFVDLVTVLALKTPNFNVYESNNVFKTTTTITLKINNKTDTTYKSDDDGAKKKFAESSECKSGNSLSERSECKIVIADNSTPTATIPD